MNCTNFTHLIQETYVRLHEQVVVNGGVFDIGHEASRIDASMRHTIYNSGPSRTIGFNHPAGANNIWEICKLDKQGLVQFLRTRYFSHNHIHINTRKIYKQTLSFYKTFQDDIKGRIIIFGWKDVPAQFQAFRYLIETCGFRDQTWYDLSFANTQIPVGEITQILENHRLKPGVRISFDCDVLSYEEIRSISQVFLEQVRQNEHVSLNFESKQKASQEIQTNIAVILTQAKQNKQVAESTNITFQK